MSSRKAHKTDEAEKTSRADATKQTRDIKGVKRVERTSNRSSLPANALPLELHLAQAAYMRVINERARKKKSQQNSNQTNQKQRGICYYCNEKAVVYLRYADRHLCKRHFNRLVEKRFSRALREQGLKAKQTVVLAVSGGKDSLAMMLMFKKLLAKIPLNLIAVSVDEGIAGYRDESVARARAFAKELAIPHYTYSFKDLVGKSLDEIMANREGEAACGYCGVFRRQILNDKAKALGADWVVIGHNLDDAVETIFMNLLRNEPSRIVRFFEPLVQDERFVPRLRPNMWIPEKEMALYALLNDVPFENAECPYAKYSIRYYVRAMINRLEDRYPGAKFRIMRSMLSMVERMKRRKAGERSGGDKNRATGNGNPTNATTLEDELARLKTCKICGMPSNSDVCMFCKLLEEIGEDPYGYVKRRGLKGRRDA